MERIPITRDGYETLHKELRHLKTVERPNVIKAIEEARAHGDLSENAEFEAAKERQAFIEARVSELSYKLNNADIIDPEKLPKDRAVFASRVLLENVDTGEGVEYQLDKYLRLLLGICLWSSSAGANEQSALSSSTTRSMNSTTRPRERSILSMLELNPGWWSLRRSGMGSSRERKSGMNCSRS